MRITACPAALGAGLAGVALGVAAVAGCAGGDDIDVRPGAPPSTPAATRLVLVVDEGGGVPSTTGLTCDPPGGDHADPAAACTALDRAGATAIPPVPADRMCTQVFGGPQTARLTGTWRGTPVKASFSRTNGCEVARWDDLRGLLPPAAG